MASAVNFPVKLDQIEPGSTARTEFEQEFKVQMGKRLGGLAVQITSISAASARRRRLLTNAKEKNMETKAQSVQPFNYTRHRRMSTAGVKVDFFTEAPAGVAKQAASMVTTLAQSKVKIDLVVGGQTISADPSSMTAPKVTKAPDVDCVGSWSSGCTTTCKQYFLVR